MYLTLILILIFEKSKESYCGSYIPKDETTCGQYTNSTEICCFLRGAFNGQYHSMCYPFSRATYYKLATNVKINGFTYRLNCGNQRGASCGKVFNPKSYKDCGVYSNKGNSCCYYSYYANSTNNDTNCVWLGTSDVGIISYRKVITQNDGSNYTSSLNVICDGCFLKWSIYFFIWYFVLV